MESFWSVFYPEKYSNPEMDTDETLYMRMKKVCAKYPTRIALQYGGKKLTFAALIDKIDEVAKTWRKLGVKKGDIVIMMMGNNPMNIISVYALDKLGASASLAVPILAPEHFERYANDLGARFCVMSCRQYENFFSTLPSTKITTVIIGKYGNMISGLNRISFPFYGLSGYDSPKPKEEPEGIRVMFWKDATALPDEEGGPSNLPYDKDNRRTVLHLFPSSVADGLKPVKLSARSINLSANHTEMVLKANEDVTGRPARTLCINESCFAFGFVFGTHDVLCSGQTVLIFTWYDNEKVFFALIRYRPDVVIGYNSTVASINKAGIHSGILRPVERIIVGGGLLTSSQKATLFEIAQRSGRKLSVCSIAVCDEVLTYAYGPSDLESDRLLGFPLPGIIMRVVDSETGLDVPDGAEGEISVYSPLSSEVSIADINSGKKKNYKRLPDGRIWYFTGMIGKQYANKMFYIVGNKSREARIGSYPVYPDMVDEAVQMTEGVVECCSVIIEDTDGPVLVSAAVPEEQYFYDNSMMEDLRDRITAECESMLHEAMRPSEIVFFVSLPKNTSGSYDYEAIKKRISLVREDEMADDNLPDSEAT